MARLINEFKNSRFLTKHDVDPPIVVTISKFEEMNVAPEGTKPDIRPVLFLQGRDRGLVLNWTNIQKIARILGQEDVDQWTGHRVVLYHDPDIAFAGKIVGGIRIREAPPEDDADPESDGEPDDDIPFDDEP